MAGDNASGNSRPVYSTEGGRVREERVAAQPSGPPSDGIVRVGRSSAGRRGKTVTLVTGLNAAHTADGTVGRSKGWISLSPI